MKIYGLIGPSGTGKSFKAQSLTSERNISCIIDDGLFIKGAKILAGISAKKESTKLAAIRRALFMDPEHAKTVKEAIKAAAPDSILIIGTSVPMVERIIERLDLPKAEEMLFIENISTTRDIRIAQRYRKEEGKHVIPVPTFEVSKDFSGYFIDPLKIFRIIGKDKRVETLEKTVVRPTYSYFGRYYISDTAIESIVIYNTQKIKGVHKVLQCSILSRSEGVIIYIDVSVIYGYKIHRMLEKIQDSVRSDISKLTGLNVLQVNITAKRLVFKADNDL